MALFATASLALSLLALAQKSSEISQTIIDQAAIAAAAHQGVRKPQIIAHVDLTKPFDTQTQWTFVAVRNQTKLINDSDDKGPITLCLVNTTIPDCFLHLYRQTKDVSVEFRTPYGILDDRVVYPDNAGVKPLFLLKVRSAFAGDSDTAVATALFEYRKSTNKFTRVFLNMTGSNNNQGTRFIDHGPLQGDIVVNEPTENAPYTYWIQVSDQGASGQYKQILHYRAHTGYNDGNPLSVDDSEMPAVLQHLGLWKPGDPPPVPSHLPHACTSIYMKNGVEWCR